MDRKSRFQTAKKLWEILEIALEDLKTVEESENYVVNMGFWQRPASRSDSEKCEVCLAGAVMANTYKISPNFFVGYESGNFGSKDWIKFTALDYLRIGFITSAYQKLYDVDLNGELIQDRYPHEELNFVDYQNNREKFWEYNKQLLAYLTKHDL
jgi:hypothetical protein